MRSFLSTVIAIILLFSIVNLHAAPTGSDLLVACSHAQDNGYDSIQGNMCAWYVIPCNCSYDEGLPEVCAPNEIEVSELADIVITGLRDNEDLQHLTATKSATIVLAEKFSCK